VRGPRILTTGEPFVAVGGTPYYVRPVVLTELSSPAQATKVANRTLALGADAIKLHTGAVTNRENGGRAVIAADLVRSVTAEADRMGKPVFAHPQSELGLRAAIEGGVGVLAHVTEELEGWPPDVLSRALDRRIALIPTLKLLAGTAVSRKQQGLLKQVSEFCEKGGQILFGTDVGFLSDYDPSDEYLLMQEAGMKPTKIMASLTTEPTSRFRTKENVGRLMPEYEADLVVLEGDPAIDIRNLARIRYTIKGGKFIYKRP